MSQWQGLLGSVSKEQWFSIYAGTKKAIDTSKRIFYLPFFSFLTAFLSTI